MATCSMLVEHSGNAFPRDEVLIILFNMVVILLYTRESAMTSKGKNRTGPWTPKLIKGIPV